MQDFTSPTRGSNGYPLNPAHTCKRGSPPVNTARVIVFYSSGVSLAFVIFVGDRPQPVCGADQRPATIDGSGGKPTGRGASLRANHGQLARGGENTGEPLNLHSEVNTDSTEEKRVLVYEDDRPS